MVTTLLLAAMILGIVAFPSYAAEKGASFVIDGNSGAVLHDQAGDEPRYPASLTKMMTLYLAFAEIEAGRMNDDTMLTVSVTAASMAPSKLDLEVGERISLGNALKAIVTKSANDMAVAVAEAIAGSEAEFARRMTERARQIGMKNTTFRNASGLPDPGQVTTARDMVTLGLRLRDDFPKQFALFRLTSFSYGGKTYRTHNSLMKNFVGMDGIKTGYTRASGFNLVSSVQRDGKYVVGAVFGGATASVRNAHMRVILFRALGSASTEKTRKPALVARKGTAPKPVAAAAPAKLAKPQSAKNAAAASPAKAPAQANEKPSSAGKVDHIASAIAQSGSAGEAGEPAIKIAKVRSVNVAGEVTAATGPDTAQTPAAEEATKPRERAPFATASSVPKLGLGQTTAKAAPSANPPATFKVASGPSPAKPAALGLRPSAGPEPVPAEPAKETAAAAAGGYQIQVGAFATADEAERHLDTVRGRASTLLKNHRAMAQPAQVGNKQVYRARFAEFDSAGALAACSTLRQQKVDCMVLRSQ